MATPRIGFLLMGSSQAGLTPLFDAFRAGLHELGWIENQNIAIEYRFAGESPDRLPELAAELVRLKVDVMGVTLQSVEITTADDFEHALASVLKGRAEALVVGPANFCSATGGGSSSSRQSIVCRRSARGRSR